MSNKSQIKSGIVLSYLTMIVHNGVNFIYTPIMIRMLGQSEYGLYNLVASFIAYLGLLSFGFDNTYMRYYSQYRHTESKERVNSLNGMFFTVFSIIGIIAFTCGFILSQSPTAVFGDKLQASEIETAKTLMILLSVNIGITFPCNLFKIYINANEKFVFAKLLTLAQSVINPFIVLPLLLMGFKSVALIIATLTFTIVTNLISIIYCFKKLGLRFNFKGFDFKIFKGIAAFSFFIFLGEIVDEINWHLDKFILGRISGTVEVAIYSVAASLSTYFRSFSTSISSVFAPRVNKIVALKEGDGALTDLMTKIGRVQFLVLSLAATGFVFCGWEFCNLWVGDEYSRSYTIALALILPSLIPLIQNVGVSILAAKDKHKFRSVAYFIIALFNVVLSIPLGMKWGGLGCAIGTGISVIVGNGIIINIYYKHIGIDIKKFWISILSLSKGLIIPIAFGIAMRPVLSGIYAKSTSTLIGLIIILAYIVVFCVVYFISMYFLGMNKFEKGIINKFFGKFKSILKVKG